MLKHLNSLLFKIKYLPQIYGKKNISKNKQLILCGNHLDERDNETINSILNSRIIWTDNIEDSICELNKGNSIGLFPEGTINTYEVIKLRIENLEKKIEKIHRLSSNGKIKQWECMAMVQYYKKAIEEELNNLEQTKIELYGRGISVIDDEILLPFDDKITIISQKTHVPVIPFYINGDYSLKKLTISFGKQINDIDISYNVLRENIKKLKK